MTSTQLRIDDTLYKKIKVIALQNKRSANSQIVFILENAIKEMEKITGEIKVTEEE